APAARADRGADGDRARPRRPALARAGDQARAAARAPGGSRARRAGLATSARLGLLDDEEHGHRRAPAHALWLLGPEHVGDDAVAVRVGGHHDRLALVLDGLLADARGGFARS